MYNGDLISREQAIEEIKSVFEWHDVVTVDRLVEHIKVLPSAQKTGKWKYTTHYGDRYIVCSVCHAERRDDLSSGWNYCPCCGAYMRGEEE